MDEQRYQELVLSMGWVKDPQALPSAEYLRVVKKAAEVDTAFYTAGSSVDFRSSRLGRARREFDDVEVLRADPADKIGGASRLSTLEPFEDVVCAESQRCRVHVCLSRHG